MSSSVEVLEGLKRRLVVTIPAEEVEKAYQERLKKVAKTANISGFRPGKVPLNILEKRFGKEMLHEVANELVQSTFRDAIVEHKLQIAGNPHVDAPEIVAAKPLEFIVTFETYPEVELKDLEGNSVEKLKAEVTEDDVNKMLGEMQKQQAEWNDVDRAAKTGDRAVVDFEGSINGEPFDRGDAKDFQIELGSNRMIPGFEEGIVGAKPGETRDVKVTFPKDYPSEELADKEAVFKITVHKVIESQLPELTDELAKKVGFEKGLEALRVEVRQSMEKEVGRVLEGQLKNSILDKLIETNPLEVPTALIEAEIDHLQQMTRQQMASQYESPEEAKKVELPREPYEEQAKKRVILGLLLGEVIKQHEIKADSEKVRTKIEEIASTYQKPEEIISWYYNNKRMLSEVESVVLENEACYKLLEQLEIKESAISYEEAMKQAQEG